MAITIDDKPTTRKVKVKRNFERDAYMFMRISGLLLLFLAIQHTFLQIILNDVHDLSVNVVADNWSRLTRRFSEWVLMVFALAHGLNGLKNILEDYVHSDGVMRTIKMVLLAFYIITVVVVSYAIITFDPDAAREAVKALGG